MSGMIVLVLSERSERSSSSFSKREGRRIEDEGKGERRCATRGKQTEKPPNQALLGTALPRRPRALPVDTPPTW